MSLTKNCTFEVTLGNGAKNSLNKVLKVVLLLNFFHLKQEISWRRLGFWEKHDWKK